jgi:copper(I)-binding protein
LWSDREPTYDARMTAALRIAAAAILLAVAAGPAATAEYVRADLRLSAPWARASASKTAEAYLTIRNTGTVPERLLAISSPVAKRVEMQRYEAIGGVNKASRISAVEIPPGKTVTLAPSGTVLSLVGLKRPLQRGTTVTLTLTFEQAGAVSVFAPVLAATADKAPEDPKNKKPPVRKPRRRRR